jgi:hypothetical protein
MNRNDVGARSGQSRCEGKSGTFYPRSPDFGKKLSRGESGRQVVTV